MGTPCGSPSMPGKEEVSNPLGWDGDTLNPSPEEARVEVSNPLGWDGD